MRPQGRPPRLAVGNMAAAMEGHAKALLDDVMAYLATVKSGSQTWRLVLNHQMNRSKTMGGSIIPSIKACHTMMQNPGAAVGANWVCQMAVQSSLISNDGRACAFESVPSASQAEAMEDMCHRAIALLLLANAQLVLLQPKQWRCSTNEIVTAVMDKQRAYVESWTWPAEWSAVGDQMGDAGAPIQLPPQGRTASCDTPVANFIGAQDMRDR